MAVAIIVAVKTAPKSKNPFSGPANSPDKIKGFKNIMYAIVRNVVTPAITSVLKFVLCFLYSKYFSSIKPPNKSAYNDSLDKSLKKTAANIKLQPVINISVYKVVRYSTFS